MKDVSWVQQTKKKKEGEREREKTPSQLQIGSATARSGGRGGEEGGGGSFFFLFFSCLSINAGVNGCEVQSARRSFASSFGPVGQAALAEVGAHLK